MKRWTDAEVRDWLEWLAPTVEGQRASLRYLLAWAKADGMSKADQTICRRAWRMVEE